MDDVQMGVASGRGLLVPAADSGFRRACLWAGAVGHPCCIIAVVKKEFTYVGANGS